VQHAAGGYGRVGHPQRAKAKPVSVGGDGGILWIRRVGESSPAVVSPGHVGMGGMADTEGAELLGSPRPPASGSGIRSVAVTKLARTGRVHSSAEHGWVGVMDGKSPRRNGVSG